MNYSAASGFLTVSFFLNRPLKPKCQMNKTVSSRNTAEIGRVIRMVRSVLCISMVWRNAT